MAMFENLVGKTLTAIRGAEQGHELEFDTADGETYRMYHGQDCCESVLVEDICGALADLIGSPIIQAEESTSDAPPEGAEPHDEANLWTFYRIATAKGQVVIRWHGSSNGYYGVSVDFEKTHPLET